MLFAVLFAVLFAAGFFAAGLRAAGLRGAGLRVVALLTGVGSGTASYDSVSGVPKKSSRAESRSSGSADENSVSTAGTGSISAYSSGITGGTIDSISGADTDMPLGAIAGRLRESRITPTNKRTAAATLQPMEAPIICSPVEKTPTRNVAIAAARKRTLVAITGEALLLRTRSTFDFL